MKMRKMKLVGLVRNDSFGVWDVDGAEMTGDEELSRLFHSFGKSLVMDQVKYPGEQVINGRVEWNPRVWNREILGNLTNFDFSEERDV
jgi:hypothetical protein